MARAHSPTRLLNTFLECLTTEIIPRTTRGVEEGNKIFGAAILRKVDLSLVIAETNNEKECPLYHGEIHTIKRFYEIAAHERPSPKECIFLTTHEPCSLCLSAITWSGFDNFHYLFTYEDTRDAFSIPYDIEITQEVFQTPVEGEPPEARASRSLYNRTNKFFKATSLATLLEEIPSDAEKAALSAKITDVKRQYASLSDRYQSKKGTAAAIVFG
ncbi:cytidine deaminase-like protein [Daedalea quercina L-15889]|uniref:Cytidine deaminase-like protein n=1 Tax=Daedalea quercina L-15889 TaxID=1314783 RepID=A0A165L5M8_9APHY|nr:cytidine deaminase-like protein [Daedalea quercina L-15889]